MGPRANEAFRSLLQPYSEDFFQKSVVDPTMKQYQEQVLPSIAQSFISSDMGSSSALNQALAQSSEQLAGTLAGHRLGLQQTTQAGQSQGLGILGNMLGQKTFEPMTQGPGQGILGNILELVGTLGGAYLGDPTGKLGDLMKAFAPQKGGIQQPTQPTQPTQTGQLQRPAPQYGQGFGQGYFRPLGQ